jgi:hypothetical protein
MPDKAMELIETKFGKTFIADHFYSTETLHKIFEKHPKNGTIITYLDFIEKLNGLEFFRSYIARKNSKNQTILFYPNVDFESNVESKTIEWLLTKFDNDKQFLENFLLEIDVNGDHYFTAILKKCLNYEGFHYLIKTFHFLIEHFGQGFVRRLLLIQKRSLVNLACKQNWNLRGFLNFIFDNVANDQAFFEEFVGDKLIADPEVKQWMEYHFELPFELIERDDGIGPWTRLNILGTSFYIYWRSVWFYIKLLILWLLLVQIISFCISRFIDVSCFFLTYKFLQAIIIMEILFRFIGMFHKVKYS